MANPARSLFLSALTAAISVFVSTKCAAQATDKPQEDFSRPVAGYTTVEALTERWQRIEIFFFANSNVRLPNNRPWIEYVARRTSGGSDEPGEVTWTSSRECPALYNTLVWLSTLVAPRIEIAGITPSEAAPEGRRPVSITADGLDTTVWGRGTQPDYTAFTRVEISSNGGLIAEFGQAATENLASCWSSRRPNMDMTNGERG